MRRIILIFVLIPYLSWSMDDVPHAIPLDSVWDDTSYLTMESQDDDPDQPTLPRSSRSNSCYVRVVNDVLRRSREVSCGLAELEEGVGMSTPRNVLTNDQIADYFFTSMDGQNLPGLGVFNHEDKDQCDYLRGLISVIKKIDPKRYDGIVRSITHHRSRRYTNTALVEVLGKVVASIDSLNEKSNSVATSHYEAAIAQLKVMEQQLQTEQDGLKLANKLNDNLTYRYRMTTLWTLVGGGVAVAVTNLLQHFLSTPAMAPMCPQMQNTTMS